MSLNATYSRYQCMIIEFLVQHLHRKGRSRLFLGVCLGPGRSATWLRRPTGRSTNVEWLDQTPWCLTNQNDIYIYNGKHDHYTVYLESQCHKPAKLGDGFFYHPSEKHMKCPVTYVLHGGHLCLLNH